MPVSESARLELWGAHTTRTLRPIWVAEELGLDYRLHAIGPRTGETQTDAFTALNPKQKIPCLIDGELALSESLAISRYLLSSYGNDSFSLATSPAARAREDEWCCYVLGELDETSLYIIRRHRDLAHIYGDSPVVVDSCFAYLQRHLLVVEAQLTDREFVLDGGFSLADIMLTSCLIWADLYGVQLMPHAQAYVSRVTARDAFVRASRINHTPMKPSNKDRAD